MSLHFYSNISNNQNNYKVLKRDIMLHRYIIMENNIK